MKKIGRAGSTFGTVVAAAAVLALATTGGAVAGGLITSKQIKNNTIKSIDVRDGNLTGTDVADRSLRGADVADGSLTSADLAGGTVPRVRWALVNKAHTAILSQSGGISIAATNEPGGVFLNMGSNVAGGSISATNAYVETDGDYKGSIMATVCGGAPYGGPCLVPGTNNTNHVWVYTQNPANTAGENHAFYVTVIG